MCIISQNKKYVFIHIPKNAGSSIRQYLKKQSGMAFKPGGIYQHVGMEHIIEKFPETKDYFSFCIVRNPWDRMWSFYKFRLMRNKHCNITFEEFLLESTTHEWSKTFRNPDTPIQQRSQLDWITDKSGHIIVKHIIKYEELMKTFQDVCKRIKLPIENTLPRLQKTISPMHYTDAYSDTSRDFIAEHFADDIKEFGYSFD